MHADALVRAVAERLMGVAQPSEWARELSHEELVFGDDDRRFDNARFDDARFAKKNFAKQERAGWTARERAMWKLRVQADGAEKASEHMRKFFHRKNGTEAATATNSANTHGPAALVPVPRGGGAGAFAVVVVVEGMQKWSDVSFGVGHAMVKEGKVFGDADGTCGLFQRADLESRRGARTKGFGRRADRDDKELGPPIRQGSRLALHLSARGAAGMRTARFFVDGSEGAVFVDIKDDGGSSDWVAGVTLNHGASVRIVPPEPKELR